MIKNVISALMSKSNPGIRWTRLPDYSGTEFAPDIASNGKTFCFVKGGASNEAIKSFLSTDGENWTTHDIVGSDQGGGVLTTYSFKGIYITGTTNASDAGLLFRSADGQTWGSVGRPDGLSVGCFAFPPELNMLISLNRSGIATCMYYSTNEAITWNQITLPFTPTLPADVVWNGKMFVMSAGQSTHFATSPDGINWTQRAGISNVSSCMAAAYPNGDGTIVAVGISDSVAISNDNGITWTSIDMGHSNSNRSVVWTGSLFVVCGDTGLVSTSKDGINWERQTAASIASWTALAVNERGHIIGLSTGKQVMKSVG